MESSKDLFGPEFIRSLLLMLEQTDHKQFMDLSYYVLMQSPHIIIKRADPIDRKKEGIDNLKKYFEEKEEFEKCANLQKLKLMLTLGDHEE